MGQGLCFVSQEGCTNGKKKAVGGDEKLTNELIWRKHGSWLLCWAREAQENVCAVCLKFSDPLSATTQYSQS